MMTITLNYRRLVSIFTFFLFCMSGMALLFFIFFFFSSDKMKPLSAASPAVSIEKKLDYSSIGGGILALNGENQSTAFEYLRRDLELLAIMNRPDRTSSTVFLLSTKSSGEQVRVSSGQKIFLKADQDTTHFSEENTGLFMIPSLEKNGIFLRIETNKGEKTGFFLREKETKTTIPQSLKILKEAKSLGLDRLYLQYSGSSSKKRYLVELSDKKEGAYFLAAGPEDYLSWDGKRWKTVTLSNANPSSPLAQIIDAGSGLEIKIWDENGFFSSSLVLSQTTHLPKLSLKFDEIFQQLRRKSATQVSCLLGKKRVILKRGDWWLKSGSNWHTIRTIEELTAVVEHRLKGELFIFDSLEKVQGKFFVKGHLFDETHTIVQAINTAISEKKIPVKNSKPVKREPPRPIPTAKQGEDKSTYLAEDEIWENTP